MQETYVQSLGQEDPLEEGMATHSVFLPGESQGQRSLAVCSSWGRTESDTTGVPAHMHWAHLKNLCYTDEEVETGSGKGSCPRSRGG